MYPRVVRLSVCLFVTLRHSAKAVGRNEMPFGRDTDTVPSNTVLEGAPVLNGKERFGVGTPSQNLHCKLRLNCGMVTINSL